MSKAVMKHRHLTYATARTAGLNAAALLRSRKSGGVPSRQGFIRPHSKKA